MARLPRLCLPGIAQHIIQRGTNRQPCFGSTEDMAAYAAWLDEYARSGTLWEGRFRSCLVEAEDYLLTCQRYIELNPVRAGMVSRPGDYHWSSFHANGVGVASRLISHHPVYLALGHSPAERQACYRKLFETRLDDDDLVRIRGVTHQGLVLGSEWFVREVEQLAGRRARPLKRGPRPRADSGEEFLL
jgi:putative transposase